MSTIFTIARKELKSYFLSPVAVIFLGLFLLLTLFVFFTYARFFARNIADVRPLFEWLPALLIFFVSAVTMRAWSEEEKIGTLEILLTLPLRTIDLVLGKFLAGMLLVGLALALTLPLPLTVSWLGDLDWGPVLGGYLGALLLASSYMAIGLCVSSRTDNQIVSLMVTAVLCGVLFLVGSEAVVGVFGDRLGEMLRALGSGSRFASIERGVLDLRDVVYYASLATFFLVLNVHFLDMKRLETSTSSGRTRARVHWATIALVALNVVALNLWLAPVTRVRADLTDGGEYSLSDATRRVLGRLGEPLAISGYFSERTHPMLAPLVPQIRDLLAEYQIHGRGRVRVEFRNPNEDEELEEELGQAYNIRTVPFRVSGRHEQSVVNSYFHILLRYADQYEVLTFNDLIEIDADEQHIDVRLRNLEYDLTRSIKNLAEGFQSIDAVFAGLDTPAKLTLYASPGTLPEEFKEAPESIRKVAGELRERSAGRFSFEEIDPSGDPALQQEIFENYGFRPTAVSLFGSDRYFLYMLFESGERIEAIFPQGDLGEAALRTTIEASIKRATPGFLKTVALLTEEPKAPPPNPNLPPQFQRPPPPPEYRRLSESLEADFTLRRTQLDDGVVPGDVDVLIVARPGTLSDKQRFAIDQYLMRGGAIVALVGAYEVQPRGGTVAVTESDPGLLEMLAGYGVRIDDAFVLDERNARFPVPIQEQRGMVTLQRIHFMDYPFFPDIRRDGFNRKQMALAGLQNIVLNWGSQVTVDDEIEGVEAETLMSTSPRAWTLETTEVLPATVQRAEAAFPPKGPLEKRSVAVTLVGSFASHFADKPSPLLAGDDAAGDAGDRTLETATPDARLVVVGSSAFASDLVSQLGGQFGAAGAVYRGNFQLVRNLIDWALEDTDLLQIRGGGAFARTLPPMSGNEKSRWELANYALVFVALAVVVFITSTRRRRAQPIALAIAATGSSK